MKLSKKRRPGEKIPANDSLSRRKYQHSITDITNHYIFIIVSTTPSVQDCSKELITFHRIGIRMLQVLHILETDKLEVFVQAMQNMSEREMVRGALTTDRLADRNNVWALLAPTIENDVYKACGTNLNQSWMRGRAGDLKLYGERSTTVVIPTFPLIKSKT